MKKCVICLKEIEDSHPFCQYCGASQETTANPVVPFNGPHGQEKGDSADSPLDSGPIIFPSTNDASGEKNRSIKHATLVLTCFFFGILGVHRFLTGKIKSGLLMLITGGGGLIWYFLDLTLVTSGRFTDKKGFFVQKTKSGWVIGVVCLILWALAILIVPLLIVMFN